MSSQCFISKAIVHRRNVSRFLMTVLGQKLGRKVEKGLGKMKASLESFWNDDLLRQLHCASKGGPIQNSVR